MTSRGADPHARPPTIGEVDIHLAAEGTHRRLFEVLGAHVRTIAGERGTPDEAHSAIRRVYSPCRQGVEVVLVQLAGAGHVWPGGIRDYNPELLGAGTSVIDANSEIWRFFSRFRR